MQCQNFDMDKPQPKIKKKRIIKVKSYGSKKWHKKKYDIKQNWDS